MKSIENFFKLRESGTSFSKELVAGATTFFAMVYIIFVNPAILSKTGIPHDAVFVATILATVIGTLVMALFANVPYALAPGMGLNAFFTYTVCLGLQFSWQEALALVFICGIINVVITVTKVRKSIIKAIPKSLQNAIGGGIGLFIAYIGLKDGGILKFTIDPGHWVESFGTIFGDASAIPEIVKFDTWGPVLAILGLILTIVLLVLKVRGAILWGIVASAVLGIFMGLTTAPDFSGVGGSAYGDMFVNFGNTFGKCFVGFGTLFSQWERLPLVFLAIFAFSLTDTFDTIGTFIGTGRRSGIFTDADLTALETSTGFKTKMDRALVADAVATSVGAVLGTSNTTTYIESGAGIEAGGRTGLTSVFTAILFLLCLVLYPLVAVVPAAATAPALIIVGIMMAGAFKEIDWSDFAEAVPAFLAASIMAFAYSISIGIAFGFIFYVIIRLCQKRGKEIHPILWVSTGLFFLYFVLMSLNELGILG
ncbi:MAG TPA: NCS2 family permease [Candidatus Izemoplasmatales bacterium]|nr:NCS2 family permease [Candidatus Izemoplasmatales bacterium]